MVAYISHITKAKDGTEEVTKAMYMPKNNIIIVKIINCFQNSSIHN